MSDADSPALRLGAAAAMLGVSQDTLRVLCLSGEVPYYLLGSSHRRFRPSDLAAYLDANRRPGIELGDMKTATSLHAVAVSEEEQEDARPSH